MNEKFALFTETVDKHFRSFVNQLHEYLTVGGVFIIPANFWMVPSIEASCHIFGTTIKLCSISLSSGTDMLSFSDGI